MIFPQQNTLIKIAAVFSALTLVVFIVFSRKLMPVFQEFATGEKRRALPFMAALFPRIDGAAPFLALIAALAFAVIGLAAIIYFFEHTQSPEIHYFGLFAFSFTFEAFRAALPLKPVFLFSPFFLLIAERALVFCRFWASAALFASGLFAAGFKPRKETTLILPFSLVALIVAVRIPADVYTFNSVLAPVLGFGGLFAVMELTMTLAAAASFLVGVRVRGVKEYAPAGGAVLLLAAGRLFLQNADVFIVIPVALAMLLAGLYLFCANVRKVYMWL